jgi:hypothetical protein
VSGEIPLSVESEAELRSRLVEMLMNDRASEQTAALRNGWIDQQQERTGAIEYPAGEVDFNLTLARLYRDAAIEERASQSYEAVLEVVHQTLSEDRFPTECQEAREYLDEFPLIEE